MIALTRRALLARSLQVVGGLALGPLATSFPRRIDPGDWGQLTSQPIYPTARVSVPTIYSYKAASFKAERIGVHHRDDLLPLQELVTSPGGPAYNPIWLRLLDGSFSHSGRVQLIRSRSAN
ncbi:MAG: hypothetical protein PHQ40_16285, partial [Anaerolineaceae bacterium]|nr:hypothetical protein [Anaerolineaceae bacterium]